MSINASFRSLSADGFVRVQQNPQEVLTFLGLPGKEIQDFMAAATRAAKSLGGLTHAAFAEAA